MKIFTGQRVPIYIGLYTKRPKDDTSETNGGGYTRVAAFAPDTVIHWPKSKKKPAALKALRRKP